LLGVFYDQDSPRSEGVFVPFFGRLACTRDGPARLALRLGVPVVPAFLYREQDGEHHTLRIHPPVALPEGAPDAETATVELAARMTHAIEQAVRERPDLFAWAHRRWRTQPPGEPRPYPSRRRR
jgi:KDO2-lipid IV(A) lauroyltransferase